METENDLSVLNQLVKDVVHMTQKSFEAFIEEGTSVSPSLLPLNVDKECKYLRGICHLMYFDTPFIHYLIIYYAYFHSCFYFSLPFPHYHILMITPSSITHLISS